MAPPSARMRTPGTSTSGSIAFEWPHRPRSPQWQRPRGGRRATRHGLQRTHQYPQLLHVPPRLPELHLSAVIAIFSSLDDPYLLTLFRRIIGSMELAIGCHPKPRRIEGDEVCLAAMRSSWT